MTESESQPTPAKSSSRTLIIAVLAIIVLAAGGLVTYKLTNKKDAGFPAYLVVKKAEAAVVKGDTAAIAQLSTSQGKTQLLKLKPTQLRGLQFGGCSPVPGAKVEMRLCVSSRPGAQLKMWLTAPDGKWVVDQAEIGPVGLPPTPPSS